MKGDFYMYKENSEINKGIERFTKRLLINGYTGKLWDAEELNSLDRKELAGEFASEYFTDEKLKAEGYDSIGGVKHMDDFKDYVARQIDRLIPRLYFMEANRGLSEKYTSLLTKRIFTTNGKDGLACTKDLEYKYEQNFDEEEAYIKSSKPTKKQMSYLENLAKKNGFQLCNSEYLSKNYAASLIEYLNEQTGVEPVIFDFFTTAI